MRRAWSLLSLVALGAPAWAMPIHSAVCAPTAEAALARWLAGAAADHSGGTGYRVVDTRTDRVHGVRWALVARCGQPEAPLVAMALPNSAASARDEAGGVAIGQAVKVVQVGADSRLEVSGVAEESGVAGDVIRVRLARLSEDASSAAPEVRCRVVAKGVVEVAR